MVARASRAGAKAAVAAAPGAERGTSGAGARCGAVEPHAAAHDAHTRHTSHAWPDTGWKNTRAR